MNNELELQIFLAAGQLEKLEMQRDQAEFELLETLNDALGKGLPADAAARAANMTIIELLARLDLRATALLPPSPAAEGGPTQVFPAEMHP